MIFSSNWATRRTTGQKQTKPDVEAPHETKSQSHFMSWPSKSINSRRDLESKPLVASEDGVKQIAAMQTDVVKKLLTITGEL